MNSSAPTTERVIYRKESDNKPEKKEPLHWLVVKSPIYLGSLALTSLVSSILIEWAGMFFGVWSEPGADHARLTLMGDLQYLNKDFATTLFGVTPVQLAQYCARGAHDWLVAWLHYLGVDQIGHVAQTTVASQLADTKPQINQLLQPLLLAWQKVSFTVKEVLFALGQHVMHGVDAALYVTQTFIVRVVVAILSLPAFLLMGLVCFIDGLVGRDLRRLTAAIESSYRHHRFLPWIRRFFVAAWFVYLSWPGPVHPNWVFVPSLIGFGITLYFSVFWFKKWA